MMAEDGSAVPVLADSEDVNNPTSLLDSNADEGRAEGDDGASVTNSAELDQGGELPFVKRRSRLKRQLTSRRNALDKEFGKDVPSLRYLKKELSLTEQLVEEIDSVVATHRAYLESVDSESRLVVLDDWVQKFQTECELLSAISAYLERTCTQSTRHNETEPEFETIRDSAETSDTEQQDAVLLDMLQLTSTMSSAAEVTVGQPPSSALHVQSLVTAVQPADRSTCRAVMHEQAATFPASGVSSYAVSLPHTASPSSGMPVLPQYSTRSLSMPSYTESSQPGGFSPAQDPVFAEATYAAYPPASNSVPAYTTSHATANHRVHNMYGTSNVSAVNTVGRLAPKMSTLAPPKWSSWTPLPLSTSAPMPASMQPTLQPHSISGQGPAHPYVNPGQATTVGNPSTAAVGFGGVLPQGPPVYQVPATQPPPTMVPLRPLELPKFSGKGKDYVRWKQRFLQCIDPRYPEEYALARLREAVEGGTAEPLIADLLDGRGTYQVAMQELDSWFGGSDRHFDQQVRELMNYPRLTNDRDVEALQKYAVKLRSTIANLRACGSMPGTELCIIATEKIPKRMLVKFFEQHGNGCSDINVFANWLLEQLKTLQYANDRSDGMGQSSHHKETSRPGKIGQRTLAAVTDSTLQQSPSHWKDRHTPRHPPAKQPGKYPTCRKYSLNRTFIEQGSSWNVRKNKRPVSN